MLPKCIAVTVCFVWLQPGSGDVTYSIDSNSAGAAYFGVLPNGVIVANRDLTIDTVNTQTYTVSSLSSSMLGLLSLK